MSDNLELETETLETDNSQDASVDDVEAQKQLRHSQQMEWAKKEVERQKQKAVDVAVKWVAKDAELLLDIYAEDPELANEVAKKFKYSSFDEAKKFINSWEKLETKDELEDEETRFEKRYSQKRLQEKHEEAIEKAQQLISKLPSELQEDATNYFNEIAEGKTLTDAKAIEYAQMATLYVSKDRLLHDKMEDWLKYLGSSGIKAGAKPKKEVEPQTIIRNGKVVVLKPNSNQ